MRWIIAAITFIAFCIAMAYKAGSPESFTASLVLLVGLIYIVSRPVI